MKTSDFYFDLPEHFIAQTPVDPRDHAKLMVFDSKNNRIQHRYFYDLRKLLKKDDVLVINRSKVIPARIVFDLNGHKKEIFLLKEVSKGVFHALVKPGRTFKIGGKFSLNVSLECKIRKVLADGSRIIAFKLLNQKSNLIKELERIGQTPFPPYIKHTTATLGDYQTVYAKEKGSVAAPTAGLHFTKNLLNSLKKKGIKVIEVVLHVGLGTFLPVTTANIEDHVMHSEFFELSGTNASFLNKAKTANRRIIAVGTTSVRVLETAYNRRKKVFNPICGKTNIFIYPGKYQWKAVDGLITNFHLPKSTLLMLVASFLENKGQKKPVRKLFDLYETAKQKEYRFYSFGDAMFIY